MTNTTEDKRASMVDRGQIPRVTPEDAAAVFEERSDVAEPLTAKEVGEALDCTRRTALTKLEALSEDGDVASKKVGGRARVWWVPVEREELEPEPEPEGHTDSVETESEDVATGTQRREASDQLFYDVNLPGDGENLKARREAIQQIHSYLKEHGSGRRADFAEIVDVEKTGYANFNSFYTNCVTVPGTLGALPDVEPPGEGGHTYQYVGGGES